MVWVFLMLFPNKYYIALFPRSSRSRLVPGLYFYLTRFASGKNMPVKFIGRKSFDRGNTLFWYAAHLKDLGVGRTFVLTKELDTYPEKCYYKPTRVAPDFSDPSVGQMFKLMNCHYLHT